MKLKQIQIKKPMGFESWFFVIVVLLAATIVFLVLNKAWSSISPELNSGLTSSLEGHNTTSSANVTRIINQTTSVALTFDKLVPFLIIGLFAFVLIGAGAIIRHPIMIFVGVIILAVAILLAVVYSNLYSEISSSDAFSSTSADLPIQNKFMQYLPLIIFLMAIGVAVAIAYARGSTGGGTL